MKLHTLDEIVRGSLMARGYTLHWYLQFMYYAKCGLREISMDCPISDIKSVKLPVTSYKAFKIPCDFVDYVRIGTGNGQYFVEFQEKQTFNRINNKDEAGNKIPWPSSTDVAYAIDPNSLEGFSYSGYVNDKGEHLGRVFNASPVYQNSFMVMKEKGEIQLDTSYAASEIYMDYTTDGVGVDACTSIPPYAYKSIQNYIYWQHKLHGRQYGEPERREAEFQFYNELSKLRARVISGEISYENLIRTLRASVNATIKG